jgi:hypothetical protein
MSLLSLLIINGSDLVTKPWNTTFSPYIALFGQGWLIIPVSFISAALFMKTRDPVVLSMFMILSGALLSISTLFAGFPEASLIYGLFAALGIGVMFYNVFYGGR